jgi:hypothetical protein
MPIPERIWREISIDFVRDLAPYGRDNARDCMVITDYLARGLDLEGEWHVEYIQDERWTKDEGIRFKETFMKWL